MTQYDFIQWLETNGYKLQFASMSRIDNATKKTYIYSNGKLTLPVKILQEKE